jgi:hypothetical protein
MQNTIETAKIVNELFKSLTAIFPAFPQAWPNQETFEQAKAEWVKAFLEVNLHQLEKIKVGVKKFRLLAKPFVPSPGEFIAMCNPTAEDMGFPAVHIAYKEACDRRLEGDEKIWSHTVVKQAWSDTGSHELKTLTQKESFPMFQRNYEIAIRKFMNGEIMTPAKKAIEEYKPITPEVAKKSIRDLLNSLKGGYVDRHPKPENN